MTKLIMNADDFGYCEGVNLGILQAHKEGIVKSCTMMAGMPGFEHGVEILKENPTLKCGVHMTLTCYKPVLDTHKTIVDENGFFYKRPTPEYMEQIDTNEVYTEFCAQIDKCIEAGIEITHLDSHHHIHTHPILKEVVEKIVEKYKLPIRGGFKYEPNLNTVIVPIIGSFYQDNVSVEYFEQNIDTLKQYEIVDAMSHPAIIDDFLLGSTSYAHGRAKELEVLTSPKVMEILKANSIELASYEGL